MLQLGCDAQVRGMLQDKQRILEGCCQILPSLKHAKVVSDWAGLRPARDRVRLELDFHQVIEHYHLIWYLYLTLPSVIVTNYKQIPVFAIVCEFFVLMCCTLSCFTTCCPFKAAFVRLLTLAFV